LNAIPHKLEVAGLQRLSAIPHKLEVAGLQRLSAIPTSRAISKAHAEEKVASALYDKLAMPKPSRIQQGAAKQLTTKDEARFPLELCPWLSFGQCGVSFLGGERACGRVLQQLCKYHPLPGVVLEYRTVQKILGTYVEPLLNKVHRDSSAPGASSIHCQWHNTHTATGRLSSSNPNLQAMPKFTLQGRCTEGSGSEVNVCVRDAFVAREGYIMLAADYSQIELRMLAHCSQDPGLVQLLRQAGATGDVFSHLWNTSRGLMPGTPVDQSDREKAKRTVYGIIYGQGPSGLASKLGVSVEAASSLIGDLYRLFPRMKAFLQFVRTRAQQEGCTVVCSGRRRPLPNIRSSNSKLQAEAERQAVNTVFQGSAADLMKRAMLQWWKEIGTTEGVRLVAQIHDELLVECPEARLFKVAHATKIVMEHADKLHVPLVVNLSSGHSWGRLKPLDLDSRPEIDGIVQSTRHPGHPQQHEHMHYKPSF
ncbi:hypothetical protein CYMTET_51288, partial [Cymbomonas tetramitiformis]